MIEAVMFLAGLLIGAVIAVAVVLLRPSGPGRRRR